MCIKLKPLERIYIAVAILKWRRNDETVTSQTHQSDVRRRQELFCEFWQLRFVFWIVPPLWRILTHSGNIASWRDPWWEDRKKRNEFFSSFKTKHKKVGKFWGPDTTEWCGGWIHSLSFFEFWRTLEQNSPRKKKKSNGFLCDQRIAVSNAGWALSDEIKLYGFCSGFKKFTGVQAKTTNCKVMEHKPAWPSEGHQGSRDGRVKVVWKVTQWRWRVEADPSPDWLAAVWLGTWHGGKCACRVSVHILEPCATAIPAFFESTNVTFRGFWK